MKLPHNFYKPLAIGAPAPLRELPVRPERVVHFFPPHIEKIRARMTETAAQVDVLCGNLEDAIPLDQKANARRGWASTRTRSCRTSWACPPMKWAPCTTPASWPARHFENRRGDRFEAA